MTTKKTGGPAFPDMQGNYDGMTLRQYFAGKAMQGLCVGANIYTADAGKISEKAYEIADAMIEEGEK